MYEGKRVCIEQCSGEACYFFAAGAAAPAAVAGAAVVVAAGWAAATGAVAVGAGAVAVPAAGFCDTTQRWKVSFPPTPHHSLPLSASVGCVRTSSSSGPSMNSACCSFHHFMRSSPVSASYHHHHHHHHHHISPVPCVCSLVVGLTHTLSSPFETELSLAYHNANTSPVTFPRSAAFAHNTTNCQITGSRA
jgi:hypothetical protein